MPAVSQVPVQMCRPSPVPAQMWQWARRALCHTRPVAARARRAAVRLLAKPRIARVGTAHHCVPCVLLRGGPQWRSVSSLERLVCRCKHDDRLCIAAVRDPRLGAVQDLCKSTKAPSQQWLRFQCCALVPITCVRACVRACVRRQRKLRRAQRRPAHRICVCARALRGCARALRVGRADEGRGMG